MSFVGKMHHDIRKQPIIIVNVINFADDNERSACRTEMKMKKKNSNKL